MKKRTSKHETQLRNLGFEPLSDAEQAYIEHRSSQRLAQAGVDENKLSRRERRLIKKVREKPSFFVCEGDDPFTSVCDETGRHWRVGKAIDPKILEDMGLENSAEHAQEAAAFPPLEKSKMH